MSKPSAMDLLNQLKTGISAGWDQSDLSRKKLHSLYELYIFKTTIEAIEWAGIKHGYNLKIEYKDHLGHPVSPIKFQTGPHKLDTYGYVYAEVRFRGSRKRTIEVHCGAQYEGKSTVAHECDISILSTTEAIKRRSDGIYPRYDKLLLSIECKFYTSTIELSMMRGFLGLIDDIGSSRNHQIFATSAGIRSTGKKLIKHKKQSSVDDLIPTNKKQINKFQLAVLIRILKFLS